MWADTQCARDITTTFANDKWPMLIITEDVYHALHKLEFLRCSHGRVEYLYNYLSMQIKHIFILIYTVQLNFDIFVQMLCKSWELSQFSEVYNHKFSQKYEG